MFDSTLMASSHPVITSYFHASNSASWLSTAFLLTSTSLQPLMGRLSDTVGRRPLYLAGLVVLAATTAWCALAQTIGSFIAARALCGIGAAGVLSMGNIMTNDLVSIEVRGTYQAYINLFYGGGSACGAAFGGVLCDKLGWRMTFAVQIPVLALRLRSKGWSQGIRRRWIHATDCLRRVPHSRFEPWWQHISMETLGRYYFARGSNSDGCHSCQS